MVIFIISPVDCSTNLKTFKSFKSTEAFRRSAFRDYAGACHVLDDDTGMAGNMFAEMARAGADIHVIASSRRKPDNYPNGFAFIKAGMRERGRICNREQQKQNP